jgi:hypothetical protein
MVWVRALDLAGLRLGATTREERTKGATGRDRRQDGSLDLRAKTAGFCPLSGRLILVLVF